jgi:aryl-alcohol dehydrogenase (NADP+)
MPLDHYVTLGRPGVRVSPFALGAMTFGEDAGGWTPLIALQFEYSLLARTVEGELAPLAREHGMALTPWSPLKNGFLSGKYQRGAAVTDSARAAFVGGPSEDAFAVIDAVAAVADELETTSAAVAFAWLRAAGDRCADPRGASPRAPHRQPGRAGRHLERGATEHPGRRLRADA